MRAGYLVKEADGPELLWVCSDCKEQAKDFEIVFADEQGEDCVICEPQPPGGEDMNVLQEIRKIREHIHFDMRERQEQFTLEEGRKIREEIVLLLMDVEGQTKLPPEPAIRQDQVSWEIGRQDALTGRPHGATRAADGLAYASGYIAGQAIREKIRRPQ